MGISSQCRADLDSGDIKYKSFNDSSAYLFYSRALKTCPDYESLMKTTRSLIDIGEDKGKKKGDPYFSQALSLTDSLQKKYPDSLQSWFLKAAAAGNLAVSKGGKEKVELAKTIETNAKKAIAIDSTYAPAHVILGVYYRQVATISKLTKSFAKAFYGKSLEGTLTDSERELKKAISLDNKNIFAYYQLAQTYRFMHRPKEARELLNTALTIPNNDNQSEAIKKSAQTQLKTM